MCGCAQLSKVVDLTISGKSDLRSLQVQILVKLFSLFQEVRSQIANLRSCQVTSGTDFRFQVIAGTDFGKDSRLEISGLISGYFR